jgi:methyl-accepting chemotaxis protein
MRVFSLSGRITLTFFLVFALATAVSLTWRISTQRADMRAAFDARMDGLITITLPLVQKALEERDTIMSARAVEGIGRDGDFVAASVLDRLGRIAGHKGGDSVRIRQTGLGALSELYGVSPESIRDAEGPTVIRDASGVLHLAPLHSEENGQKTKIGVALFRFSAGSLDAALAKQVRAQIVEAAIVAAILAIVAFFVARSIVRPLRSLGDTVTAISQDKLDTVVPGLDRTDEVGALGRAVAVLKSHLEERAALRKTQTEDSERRAARAVELERANDRLREEVGGILDRLATTSIVMDQASGEVGASAEATVADAERAIASARDAANNVRHMADATHEFRQSAETIGDAVRRAHDATEVARARGETATASFAELARHGKAISDAIDRIRTIAAQTNMLALNATIEAARAGAAGRGFAVVASEVKALATQTAHATDQITSEVSALSASARVADQDVAAIIESLRDVQALASEIAAAVDQQRHAVAKIAEGVAEAAQDARLSEGSIAEVGERARANRASAIEISDAIGGARLQFDQLQGVVEAYLGETAAA